MKRLVKRIPHVLILLNTPTTTHHEIMRGILRFTKQCAAWSTDIRTGRNDVSLRIDLAKNRPDGIIADRLPLSARRFLRGADIPLVLGDARISTPNVICTFDCDNKSVARLAAQHLMELGFNDFAYLPFNSRQTWSTERSVHFDRALKQSGHTRSIVFNPSRDNLSDWLKRLPKPVGLFAANDLRARQAIDAASSVGIKIPSEISVVSVDNDDILCETTRPSLTSIPMNTEEIGFECARILHAAMTGTLSRKRPARLYYGGTQVVVRNSTRTISVHDRLVDKCLELMAANLGQVFSIADILPQLKVSRRTLETRFKSAIGHPPSQQLYLMRISKAKELLKSDKLTQAQIAESCGFCDSSHMNAVFRRFLKARPSAFRPSSPRPAAPPLA